MSRTLRSRWESLGTRLRSLERVLVAFSGGCDSMFLAAAARQVLGKSNVLAVMAVSESLPAHEAAVAPALAAQFDIPFRLVSTQELKNPQYVSNPSNRCFYCKDELFHVLAPIARDERRVMIDGFNASDRTDFRPGFQAAEAWEVRHPLNEADLTKSNIRALSRWLRLPTWEKPASPCLSSRIPYGMPVTNDALRRIERAEAVLQAEGFDIVRVRHHDAIARIEVPLSKIAALRDHARWERVSEQLLDLGYARVEIEERGFQSGRLNEALERAGRRVSSEKRPLIS